MRGRDRGGPVLFGVAPFAVELAALLFFGVVLGVQIWRLHSFTATYDQALFLQELWSTAHGRPFESSLSSVLSAPVALGDALPRVDYLHLGQHANVLTLLTAPLVRLLGGLALPLIQAAALTAAGLVLWRMASRRLEQPLAVRLTLAYFLSGAVIGPGLENFHDLIWLPVLGFLVVEGLLERCWWRVGLFAAAVLLVREDSGLMLFSLGLWALLRQPGARAMGLVLMLVASGWVLIVTGWIQPLVDSSLTDRFFDEKFGHLVDDVSGGTAAVVLAMLQRPLALLQAIVTPPGATLGFVLALTLPLVFIPVLSLDAVLLMLLPLLVALVSQGRTALSVTIRYVLALVPGLYLGALLWWQAHPQAWHQRWLQRCWTGAIALGLVLTLVSNPHRSLSALVPDSFVPWVHISPRAMWQRGEAAREALALIPADASVAADTPLLPSLAQREVVIRFPKFFSYRDRRGEVQDVDWIAAFPGHYSPMAPVFKEERKKLKSIRRKLRELTSTGTYQLVRCERGVVILQRVAAPGSDRPVRSGPSGSCPWLD